MWSVPISIALSGCDTLDQSASPWLPILPQLPAGRFLLVCSCYSGHPLSAPKTCVLPWVVSSDLFHPDIPEWCYLSFESSSLFKQVFLALLGNHTPVSPARVSTWICSRYLKMNMIVWSSHCFPAHYIKLNIFYVTNPDQVIYSALHSSLKPESLLTLLLFLKAHRSILVLLLSISKSVLHFTYFPTALTQNLRLLQHLLPACLWALLLLVLPFCHLK